MLFHTDDFAFESEKERNFYYKIFAGYVFNEFVQDHRSRVDRFVQLLNAPREAQTGMMPNIPPLDADSLIVSFDNHAYLFEEFKNRSEGESADKRNDRGEFADILIQDRESKTLIAIEAKLFSDWTYDKDILENRERHKFIHRQIPEATLFPVLLLKREKWDQAKKMGAHANSNYKKLSGDANPFRVLFWDQILSLLDTQSVLEYAKMILKCRSQSDMRIQIESGWMRRKMSSSLFPSWSMK